tara:strand:+ start:991 stop:1290 length:300 start_codon:yes stop_codon:yes gene_type:complete
MSDRVNKTAQILEQNPVYVAEQLHDMIKVMISRMSPDARMRSYQNVASKLDDFNVVEIAAKKAPGGAAIGVSLGLVKNVLNGRDPYFINTVLKELMIRL